MSCGSSLVSIVGSLYAISRVIVDCKNIKNILLNR